MGGQLREGVKKTKNKVLNSHYFFFCKIYIFIYGWKDFQFLQLPYYILYIIWGYQSMIFIN